jgi:hypothetical protein
MGVMQNYVKIYGSEQWYVSSILCRYVIWHPDKDAKGTVFLSFYHFCVLSVPLYDHCVFLYGPHNVLNTYHIIPTFMFVILSTSVDLSLWTVCSRVALSVLRFVCVCVCVRACVCVCVWVGVWLLYLFIFKILLIHWTPVLLAEILPIFMLLFHSFGSDTHFSLWSAQKWGLNWPFTLSLNAILAVELRPLVMWFSMLGQDSKSWKPLVPWEFSTFHLIQKVCLVV